MLAEIHNKISSNGSNLSDRLEDQLTGNFFGTIRYLPFGLALKKVLERVRFNGVSFQINWETLLNSLGNKLAFEFWPRHSEGEIDLIIKADKVLIGIEVKLYSGLSSDDEEDDVFDPLESHNQLLRYSRMLNELEEGIPKFLIFLAPMETMREVEKSMKDKNIVCFPVPLGFLSWQEVLETLKTIDLTDFDHYQSLMINDLIELLTKKGFTRFIGFSDPDKEVTMESYFFRRNNLNKVWKWSEENLKGDLAYAFKK